MFLAARAQTEFPEVATILKNHTYTDEFAASKILPETVKKVIDGIDTIFSKASLPSEHGTVTALRLMKILTRIRRAF